MKRMMIFLLGLGAMLLLSGCAASKPQVAVGYAGETILENEKVRSKLLAVEGLEEWRSPSDGYNKATRNINVLQNAADATLNEGYKYFAFLLPAELAEGSMINTAEEFMDKCVPNSASIFTIGNIRCGFKSDNRKIAVAIYAFKKQPKNHLTFNAQEVRDYLIQKNLYKAETYERVERLEESDSIRMLGTAFFKAMHD